MSRSSSPMQPLFIETIKAEALEAVNTLPNLVGLYTKITKDYPKNFTKQDHKNLILGVNKAELALEKLQFAIDRLEEFQGVEELNKNNELATDLKKYINSLDKIKSVLKYGITPLNKELNKTRKNKKTKLLPFTEFNLSGAADLKQEAKNITKEKKLEDVYNIPISFTVLRNSQARDVIQQIQKKTYITWESNITRQKTNFDQKLLNESETFKAKSAQEIKLLSQVKEFLTNTFGPTEEDKLFAEWKNQGEKEAHLFEQMLNEVDAQTAKQELGEENKEQRLTTKSHKPQSWVRVKPTEAQKQDATVDTVNLDNNSTRSSFDENNSALLQRVDDLRERMSTISRAFTALSQNDDPQVTKILAMQIEPLKQIRTQMSQLDLAISNIDSNLDIGRALSTQSDNTAALNQMQDSIANSWSQTEIISQTIERLESNLKLIMNSLVPQNDLETYINSKIQSMSSALTELNQQIENIKQSFNSLSVVNRSILGPQLAWLQSTAAYIDSLVPPKSKLSHGDRFQQLQSKLKGIEVSPQTIETFKEFQSLVLDNAKKTLNYTFQLVQGIVQHSNSDNINDRLAWMEGILKNTQTILNNISESMQPASSVSIKDEAEETTEEDEMQETLEENEAENTDNVLTEQQNTQEDTFYAPSTGYQASETASSEEPNPLDALDNLDRVIPDTYEADTSGYVSVPRYDDLDQTSQSAPPVSTNLDNELDDFIEDFERTSTTTRPLTTNPIVENQSPSTATPVDANELDDLIEDLERRTPTTRPLTTNRIVENQSPSTTTPVDANELDDLIEDLESPFPPVEPISSSSGGGGDESGSEESEGRNVGLIDRNDDIQDALTKLATIETKIQNLKNSVTIIADLEPIESFTQNVVEIGQLADQLNIFWNGDYPVVHRNGTDSSLTEISQLMLREAGNPTLNPIQLANYEQALWAEFRDMVDNKYIAELDDLSDEFLFATRNKLNSYAAQNGLDEDSNADLDAAIENLDLILVSIDRRQQGATALQTTISNRLNTIEREDMDRRLAEDTDESSSEGFTSEEDEDVEFIDRADDIREARNNLATLETNIQNLKLSVTSIAALAPIRTFSQDANGIQDLADQLKNLWGQEYNVNVDGNPLTLNQISLIMQADIANPALGAAELAKYEEALWIAFREMVDGNVYVTRIDNLYAPSLVQYRNDLNTYSTQQDTNEGLDADNNAGLDETRQNLDFSLNGIDTKQTAAAHLQTMITNQLNAIASQQIPVAQVDLATLNTNVDALKTKFQSIAALPSIQKFDQSRLELLTFAKNLANLRDNAFTINVPDAPPATTSSPKTLTQLIQQLDTVTNPAAIPKEELERTEKGLWNGLRAMVDANNPAYVDWHSPIERQIQLDGTTIDSLANALAAHTPLTTQNHLDLHDIQGRITASTTDLQKKTTAASALYDLYIKKAPATSVGSAYTNMLRLKKDLEDANRQVNLLLATTPANPTTAPLSVAELLEKAQNAKNLMRQLNERPFDGYNTELDRLITELSAPPPGYNRNAADERRLNSWLRATLEHIDEMQKDQLMELGDATNPGLIANVENLKNIVSGPARRALNQAEKIQLHAINKRVDEFDKGPFNPKFVTDTLKSFASPRELRSTLQVELAKLRLLRQPLMRTVAGASKANKKEMEAFAIGVEKLLTGAALSGELKKILDKIEDTIAAKILALETKYAADLAVTAALGEYKTQVNTIMSNLYLQKDLIASSAVRTEIFDTNDYSDHITNELSRDYPNDARRRGVAGGSLAGAHSDPTLNVPHSPLKDNQYAKNTLGHGIDKESVFTERNVKGQYFTEVKRLPDKLDIAFQWTKEPALEKFILQKIGDIPAREGITEDVAKSALREIFNNTINRLRNAGLRITKDNIKTNLELESASYLAAHPAYKPILGPTKISKNLISFAGNLFDQYEKNLTFKWGGHTFPAQETFEIAAAQVKKFRDTMGAKAKFVISAAFDRTYAEAMLMTAVIAGYDPKNIIDHSGYNVTEPNTRQHILSSSRMEDFATCVSAQPLLNLAFERIKFAKTGEFEAIKEKILPEENVYNSQKFTKS